MRTIKGFVLGLAVWLSISLTAMAHRVGVPTTTIEWNSRSGVWEVVHRLSAHDLEEALDLNIDISLLPGDELSAFLFEYVQSKFVVFGLSCLKYIGAEIERDQIWVYYEMYGSGWPILISNQLLLEAEATASALVNVRSGADVQTLTFDANTGWQSVRLRKPVPN